MGQDFKEAARLSAEAKARAARTADEGAAAPARAARLAELQGREQVALPRPQSSQLPLPARSAGLGLQPRILPDYSWGE